MDALAQNQLDPVFIQQQISAIQRADLLNHSPSLNVPIWGELEGIHFYKIRGIKRNPNDGLSAFKNGQMRELLIGLNALNTDFYFLILSYLQSLSVFVGSGTRASRPDLVKFLNAVFPGIQVLPTPEVTIGTELRDRNLFSYRGIVSGIPNQIILESNKAEYLRNDKKNFLEDSVSPFDRLIRGLQGTNWGYFVHAGPIGQQEIRGHLASTLESLSKVHSYTRMQMQKVIQETTRVTEEMQTGSTYSLSGERFDRNANYLLSLLELKAKQLQIALIEGAWKADTHFFSDQKDVFAIQNAIIRSAFHGGDNSYDPIKTHICLPSSRPHNTDYGTILNSTELSCMTHMPCEETYGYSIKDNVTFDVDQEVITERSIPLGEILSRHHKTGIKYQFPVSAFSRHTFVSGMTGSGKTTTVKLLLDQLSHLDIGIPFLVIEPSKSEYREMLNPTQETRPDQSTIVYTLGDETVNPFRINPFQFEVLETGEHVNVQTHIDYLKSVFNAAFALYPPMPYVLEICLHEVYTDRGWDLVTNENEKLSASNSLHLLDWQVFPTLEELHKKIDQVTSRLGYGLEVERDVKAALQTRIESLMTGGKGMMLNVPIDQGMRPLLKANCILELKKIGDDEQKAFIIGLLLTRLFEYRELQRDLDQTPPNFQHLTVIEEAHRLLKAPTGEKSPDFASPANQAVETFTNMLSEIRAYGEGILIVEQIPSKLVSDAVKNTNLKIIHRMVPEDERNLLKGMSNMNDAQSRYLISIPVGEAIIHSHLDDHPMLLSIDPGENLSKQKRVTDHDLRMIYRQIGFNNQKDVQRLNIERNSTGYQLARRLKTDLKFLTAWHRMQLLELSEEADGIFSNPLILWAENRGSSMEEANKKIVNWSYFECIPRGLYFGWSYEEIAEYALLWMERVKDLIGSDSELPGKNSNEFNQWLEKKMVRKNGPYPTCEFCTRKCYLVYDVNELLEVSKMDLHLERLMHSSAPITELFDEMIDFINQGFGPKVKGLDMSNIGICILGRILSRGTVNHKTQVNIAKDYIVYQGERSNDVTAESVS